MSRLLRGLVSGRSRRSTRRRERDHLAAHRIWGSYGSGDNEAYARLDAWTEPGSHPQLRVQEPGKLAGKPLAILTATGTASAAEDFLIYADALEHATRIGQSTYGSTGQPLPLELPGGGKARICAKRDTWPDGTDFVGVGVEPDLPVPLTVEDLLAGRDRTLEVAVEHLLSELEAAGPSRD